MTDTISYCYVLQVYVYYFSLGVLFSSSSFTLQLKRFFFFEQRTFSEYRSFCTILWQTHTSILIIPLHLFVPFAPIVHLIQAKIAFHEAVPFFAFFPRFSFADHYSWSRSDVRRRGGFSGG